MGIMICISRFGIRSQIDYIKCDFSKLSISTQSLKILTEAKHMMAQSSFFLALIIIIVLVIHGSETRY